MLLRLGDFAMSKSTKKSATVSNTVSVVMSFEKETPGAIRYSEGKELSDPTCKIGTLYVRKAGMGWKNIPQKITVTVSVA